PAGAPRRHPVARTAGEPHLRLGRRGDQQRRRRPHPRHAPQARPGRHPQRARPGLARHRQHGSRGMKWQGFPRGPMCSLRRALMLWLFPLFLLVGAGSAAVTYWSYVNMVGMFLDDQMQQLAEALSTNDIPQPVPQTLERVQHWGAYVVQTWTPD